MQLSLLASTILYTAATAWPHYSEPRGNEYQAPKGDDRRSPCPGLNVMANHGFLPRSGKEITLEHIRYATGAAFNFAPGVFDSAVADVLGNGISTTNAPNSTFNLDDLVSPKAHGIVEVDGSLSRSDLALGDNLHYNQEIWDAVAENLGLNRICKGDKIVTVETAAKARNARQVVAKAANKDFDASELQSMVTRGTTALYLLTLWDGARNGAPKTWVKTFFEHERIPYKEGFQKPAKAKTAEDLGNMFQAVSAVKA
ncbi:unnamed protein product [Clonostachys byssicola]|uniref:Heme haloperoxidase family profile domain-containing protein n=1 Tax=Clonostachys byssicola TaxID=160290 RepID=A0A9N9Y3C1_9HYPO|nr:unnamed protein product [Clonostachys byssicola]